MLEKQLEQEIAELRAVLKRKEADLANLREGNQILQQYGLNNEEIARYSRQILLPEIGVEGQLKIKNSSVLIVGVGGLGCPAALYLTGAGVGHIGLIDYDDVEVNNLHRQLLYINENIGMSKVISAAENLRKLNNNVKITPHKILLDSTNAIKIVETYDIVLDATDNVPTRYLLNDVCVLTGKPLISGSALKFEGQLSVYNYNGPCYRCIFSKPPPPETVTNCGDGGVLGAAVGTIGVLQALEALKIILNVPRVYSGYLLLFDGLETTFRSVKLRPKNPSCEICGNKPTLCTLIDYEQFCGAKANDKNPNLSILERNERITVNDYNEIMKTDTESHVLIDVRSAEEFQICQLKNALNIPFNDLNKKTNLEIIKHEINKIQENIQQVNVYVLCRRGNDSQKAVKVLKNYFKSDTLRIRDIIGGIHAWSAMVDSTFPIY
ncbi:adenylyltransferase and sulfurtransferase MOCS3 [Orussus abietinus]|uniref:adenylyltransferase and sulfurtransferase MOCS3 n=1 Tax=Orussus abietinus TaxID=222816 RepID=UPI0006253AAF|nr:adenylyltransferase and sulfurtransferase MOCS3 [Orussus abietinus]XP_012280700.1 adenylyltransferase and sulfurtransferase MOCS3 [Orussus abietinus]XP_012280701.1 adenylyltransferase and sulfurtransferase MOCS3 [Orussus abietinus]